MFSLHQVQTGQPELRNDGSLSETVGDSLSDALKTFNGRSVINTPPSAPAALAAGKESRSFPFDPRFSAIRDDSVQYSESFAAQRPELHRQSSSSGSQQYAACSVPNDLKRQEFKVRLIKLAGIPYSRFQRHYPKVSSCDTISGRNRQEMDQDKKLVGELLQQYPLFDDQNFQHYLASKQLPVNLFNSECFRWNTSGMLEVLAGFIFSDDAALRNVSFSGQHGYMLSFSDDDILAENQPVRIESVAGIEVSYTQNNRPVIQQQATRGCSYAVAAMLLKQHNLSFSASDLRSTNLGNNRLIMQELSKAGLLPFQTHVQTLEALARSIARDGSAIVSLDIRRGGHNVIVDEVAAAFVLIRDPYHGWEVKVSKKAFWESWHTATAVIQVKEQNPVKPFPFV